MDSTAYLTRHGWKGDGHSLHPSGRGIKKPLLVSRKTNVLGVGLKKNDAHADQWWLRAFDSSLKSIGVTKDGVTGVVGEVKKTEWNQLDLIKSGAGKWTGLYEGFVRGKTMGGSMGEGTVTVLVKKEVDDAPKAKVEPTTLGTFAAAVEELKQKNQKKRKVVDSRAIEQTSPVTEPSREASEAERPRKKKKQKQGDEVIAIEEHTAKHEKMKRKEERRPSKEQAVSSAETTEDVEVINVDIKRQTKNKKKQNKRKLRGADTTEAAQVSTSQGTPENETIPSTKPKKRKKRDKGTTETAGQRILSSNATSSPAEAGKSSSGEKKKMTRDK